jgi:hypothetical protein
MTFFSPVIPAKAGIQGNQRDLRPWIPAFAGMTDERWFYVIGKRF